MDAGTFNLVWQDQRVGATVVSCRELPGFRVEISPGEDVFARVQVELRCYLASRYGIEAEVHREINVARFRCLLAA